MESLVLLALMAVSAGSSAHAEMNVDQAMNCKVDVSPGQASPFLLQFVIKGAKVVAALSSCG